MKYPNLLRPLFVLGMTIPLSSCNSKGRSGTDKATEKEIPTIVQDIATEDKPFHPVELTLLPSRGNSATGYLMSKQWRFAELTPPGPRLRVDAELLATSAKADRWKLAIIPEKGQKEIKEVEYTGEPIIVWSQGAQHVLLTKDSQAVFKLRKSGKLGEEQKNGTR
jgi:hypothetical protein